MHRLVLQFLYSFLLRGFLRLIVGVKFDKADFLLKENQVIIVANHNSHLDTMTLLASVPRKIIHKVKPVAAADHFARNRWQARLSEFFINALLIPRKRDKENPDNDPINKMVKALDDGFSLIIFPEGTRGEPEKEQPLKPGVGIVLSKKPEAKYVPAYMTGMGKAMPKGDILIIPFNSTLNYGRPTLITSPVVTDILNQIQEDFSRLKSGTYST